MRDKLRAFVSVEPRPQRVAVHEKTRCIRVNPWFYVNTYNTNFTVGSQNLATPNVVQWSLKHINHRLHMSIENPTKRVVLRHADRTDSALIADMHARSWASAYRGMLPDRYLDEIAPAERRALWPDKMTSFENGSGAVLIAELDGEPIGFVCMLAPDENGSVYIDNLHALPDYKRTGAGTAMLDAARDWARKREARGMHLSVLDTNEAAIRFYASRGWTYVSREHEIMGGVDIVALTYQLIIE